MSRPITQITLTSEEFSKLTQRVRGRKTAARDRLRAQIVLLRASGMKQQDVAERTGTSQVTVSKWTRRFLVHRLPGLDEAPGRGRKPSLPDETVSAVITRATQPPAGRTRWSVRSMAREAGISRHSVHQIWKRNEIKPHRTKTFKVSNDPCFEEKFWDIIGLYLDPPEKALVFCCDEKSQ